MKKTILLLAGLAFSLVAGLKAADMSVGIVTQNNVAAGQLFAVSTSSPVTYTPATVAGPGISIKKLIFAPNSQTYSAQTTVQLWSTPDSKTYTAGARALTPPISQLLPTQDKPYVLDFMLPDGSDRSGGIFCAGFPVLLETGTNTVNAQMLFMKGNGNPVLPGSAAGVVAH